MTGDMNNSGFFRKARIAVLLFILAGVAGDALLTRMRTTDWDTSLWVAVYPINADKSPVAGTYIRQLKSADFKSIEQFLTRESARYGVDVSAPVVVRLGPEIGEHPPNPPVPGGNALSVMWWSLKMRFWAWRMEASHDGPPANISMFVLYHDPDTHDRLEHSLGLEKGLLGVVNAYADRKMKGKNNVIIAHELLHTLGASDKYDFATNQPLYPDGYAEPDRSPRYPQDKAEIMAGRVPISDSESRTPSSLKKSMVGSGTAAEINWL